MKIKLIRLIVAGLLIFSAGSCKKFVEHGNVNVNPNAASATSLKSLLPALIEATATNYYAVGFYTSMFSQQTASYTSGTIDVDRNIDVKLSVMQGIYQTALTNAMVMLDLANTKNASYYGAIAKILIVANLTLGTDMYGEVPLSDAFKAPGVLYPAYDSQQDIYTAMQKYLDEAITAASAPGTGDLPGTEDLAYGGKMNKWVEAANLLKARLYLHTTKKGTGAAASGALAALANSISSNSNDWALTYSSRNKNPWAVNISLKVNTGNYFMAPSQRFVNAMNGTTFPGLIDPRLPFLMDKGANVLYQGLENGGGNTGNTVDITTKTFYAQETSPLLMATFAERKFMEAEALFLQNGGDATSVGSTQAAYDAYIAGITQNMTKLGVSAADMNAYLSDPLVAVGAAGLTMQNIMHEKGIALWLNPEAWVDVRRYDYDDQVFPGMALPLNQWAGMNGQFIRRSGLPNEELSRNPNAAAANHLTTDKVWWDQ